MGDRAQVAIVDEFDGSKIFIYSHHLGRSLTPIIINGIRQTDRRISDSSKLTALVAETAVKATTGQGLGINTQGFTVEHPTLWLTVNGSRIETCQSDTEPTNWQPL